MNRARGRPADPAERRDRKIRAMLRQLCKLVREQQREQERTEIEREGLRLADFRRRPWKK